MQSAGVAPILWRACAGYRLATLAYTLAVAARNYPDYAHPRTGLIVLGAIAAWTGVLVVGYLARPTRLLIGADLVVTTALLLATLAVESRERLAGGSPAITTVWAAGAVLACGALGGPWVGLFAAAVVGGATLTLRGTAPQDSTLQNVVLLLLAGVVVGYVVRLSRRTEELTTRVLVVEAATAERERLARRIHDGVLQVLSLVERRGDPELAALAAEQQVALRALVASPPEPVAAGSLDLRGLLSGLARRGVSLSMPAEAVPLPAGVAHEVTAAVAAALDNVVQHVGADAEAWVLLEDEGEQVVLSVRDEGPGIEAGRLAEAAATGRLGISQSMGGRIRDVGGEMTVASWPGQGTEVEFRVPR